MEFSCLQNGDSYQSAYSNAKTKFQCVSLDNLEVHIDVISVQKGKKISSTCRPEQKEPGDKVLIDQIISSQPGLIPQMSGFLTNKRICGCTTFVDHDISDFVYVHLMRDSTPDETFLEKAAWEKSTCSSWP